MAKGKNVVLEDVRQFYNRIKDNFPVKKMILYGSYAKGKARPDSDIDVAVVLDFPDHLQRVELTARLFHYARQINSSIEPKCVFWDEYLKNDKASILAEIIRTGIEVRK